MRCSLIITTYNWPEALELVLESVFHQTLLPNEIIIADDGSGNETKDLIEKIQVKSPVPIIHSWQEDNGFRLAMSRNKAIEKSPSEYIIVVDGDMILDKNFIKDHKKCAKKGNYIQGSRVLLQNNLTQDILNKKKFQKPSIFSSNVKNKKNMIYLPWLTSAICKMTSTNLSKIRGCNFSLFKDDILLVNGFNEDFKTWGQEDSEFAQRLYNAGLSRRDLKFSGIQYHLYHKEGSSNSNNLSLLQNTIDKNLKWCQNGIDKHLLMEKSDEK
jgi:glycosyltransferase involved in cell wall biosynthesis